VWVAHTQRQLRSRRLNGKIESEIAVAKIARFVFAARQKQRSFQSLHFPSASVFLSFFFSPLCLLLPFPFSSVSISGGSRGGSASLLFVSLTAAAAQRAAQQQRRRQRLVTKEPGQQQRQNSFAFGRSFAFAFGPSFE